MSFRDPQESYPQPDMDIPWTETQRLAAISRDTQNWLREIENKKRAEELAKTMKPGEPEPIGDRARWLAWYSLQP
jgi:hypothetical protein